MVLRAAVMHAAADVRSCGHFIGRPTTAAHLRCPRRLSCSDTRPLPPLVAPQRCCVATATTSRPHAHRRPRLRLSCIAAAHRARAALLGTAEGSESRARANAGSQTVNTLTPSHTHADPSSTTWTLLSQYRWEKRYGDVPSSSPLLISTATLPSTPTHVSRSLHCDPPHFTVMRLTEHRLPASTVQRRPWLPRPSPGFVQPAVSN